VPNLSRSIMFNFGSLFATSKYLRGFIILGNEIWKKNVVVPLPVVKVAFLLFGTLRLFVKVKLLESKLNTHIHVWKQLLTKRRNFFQIKLSLNNFWSWLSSFTSAKVVIFCMEQTIILGCHKGTIYLIHQRTRRLNLIILLRDVCLSYYQRFKNYLCIYPYVLCSYDFIRHRPRVPTTKWKQVKSGGNYTDN
jgi:hypothetical protein